MGGKEITGTVCKGGSRFPLSKTRIKQFCQLYTIFQIKNKIKNPKIPYLNVQSVMNVQCATASLTLGHLYFCKYRLYNFFIEI